MTGVGGDMSENITCGICGAEVCNTRWPHHVNSDDCEPRESGESGGQSSLGEWA